MNTLCFAVSSHYSTSSDDHFLLSSGPTSCKHKQNSIISMHSKTRRLQLRVSAFCRGFDCCSSWRRWWSRPPVQASGLTNMDLNTTCRKCPVLCRSLLADQLAAKHLLLCCFFWGFILQHEPPSDRSSNSPVCSILYALQSAFDGCV